MTAGTNQFPTWQATKRGHPLHFPWLVLLYPTTQVSSTPLLPIQSGPFTRALKSQSLPE